MAAQALAQPGSVKFGLVGVSDIYCWWLTTPTIYLLWVAQVGGSATLSPGLLQLSGHSPGLDGP